MLTSEQVKHLFSWLREQIKPPEKLKIEIADKEFKAGYLQGYKDAYRGIMGCESTYLGRIAMGANQRARTERENGAESQ